MNRLDPMPDFRYFRAAGRSLEAILAHRRAVRKAIEDVRSFVILCGAERALGGTQISGLHFDGPLPRGWMRNASAPHMAVPDTDTVRGNDLARKMSRLRIPGDAEFGPMIGAEPVLNQDSAPLHTALWPSYERAPEGWLIKCPARTKAHPSPPPDALEITEDEYRKLSARPSFNLLALDAQDSPGH